MAAKDRNVNRIIAKATTHTQARILEKLGADQVIFPEIDMGERLARSISGKNFLEYIHFSDEYTIMEIEALDDWIGKSLVDMDFYNKYHMNVVAFRRDKTTTLSNLAQYKIQSGDYLILIGKYSDAEQLEVLD